MAMATMAGPVAATQAATLPAGFTDEAVYMFNRFGSCPSNTSASPVNRVSRFVLADSNVIDPEEIDECVSGAD